MIHLKELSITRKLLIAFLMLIILGAAWDGRFGTSTIFLIITYALIKLPTQQNVTNSQSDESDENDESDNHLTAPVNFNQMSTFDSSIWTDYDEHINNQ